MFHNGDLRQVVCQSPGLCTVFFNSHAKAQIVNIIFTTVKTLFVLILTYFGDVFRGRVH